MTTRSRTCPVTPSPVALRQREFVTCGRLRASVRAIPFWGKVALTLLCAGLQTVQAQVGLTELQADSLPITLVYPTAEPSAELRRGSFLLKVAPGAPLLPRTQGEPPRKVVVLSHGTAGSPLSDHDLAATLARAGFVVAQPLHRGDNYLDASLAGPESWRLRPAEVTRTLDALAAHPTWGPQLSLERVGVHGMSAGGATALVMAGANWRVLDLVHHCQKYADEDPGFCFNGLADPSQQRARRELYERARAVPEVFLPGTLTAVHGTRQGASGLPDPRVAAVTVAVPVVALFTDENLKHIRVPVGVISAGCDSMLLPRFHSDRLLKHCLRCRTLSHLQGAGHMDLLGPWPADVAAAVANKQARGGWPEPGFDPVLRQAGFDAVAEFFRRELQP
jgi:predicted dienelactone hydrolase